jgi:hypothetical protein
VIFGRDDDDAVDLVAAGPVGDFIAIALGRGGGFSQRDAAIDLVDIDLGDAGDVGRRRVDVDARDEQGRSSESASWTAEMMRASEAPVREATASASIGWVWR